MGGMFDVPTGPERALRTNLNYGFIRSPHIRDDWAAPLIKTSFDIRDATQSGGERGTWGARYDPGRPAAPRPRRTPIRTPRYT